MALSFHSIRDNGNFLFTSGRPQTYSYLRAELSPREAWNLWQDTKNKADGRLIPLYLTPAEFERVTAFDRAHPDESRAARIQTVFEECAKLDEASQKTHSQQVICYGDQTMLGRSVLLQNPIHRFTQPESIVPPAELERAWEVYRARSAAAQPAP